MKIKIFLFFFMFPLVQFAVFQSLKVENQVIHSRSFFFFIVGVYIYIYGSDCKASAYNVGDLGSIPGWGRSSGEGNGNPLQYSCVENPMGDAWQVTVHGVTESDTTERLYFTYFTYTYCRSLPYIVQGKRIRLTVCITLVISYKFLYVFSFF